jgi:hypothetical protein
VLEWGIDYGVFGFLYNVVRSDPADLLIKDDWIGALYVRMRNGRVLHSVIIVLCLWWNSVWRSQGAAVLLYMANDCFENGREIVAVGQPKAVAHCCCLGHGRRGACYAPLLVAMG